MTQADLWTGSGGQLDTMQDSNKDQSEQEWASESKWGFVCSHIEIMCWILDPRLPHYLYMCKRVYGRFEDMQL